MKTIKFAPIKGDEDKTTREKHKMQEETLDRILDLMDSHTGAGAYPDDLEGNLRDLIKDYNVLEAELNNTPVYIKAEATIRCKKIFFE